MSAGKNPHLRYSIIDRCLGSKHKRYWTPDELLEKFAEYDLNVELRSLKYDLQNMRDNTQLKFNAPIGYSRANKSYYYTDEGYSIDGERLSHHDLMALTFVVNLLEQVEGATMLQQAKGAVSKLNKAKTTKENTHLLTQEPQPYYKGIRYLGQLVEAIFHAHTLCIAYRKFSDDKATEHIFHSYQLKLYNQRWYVRGYSEKHKEVIVLALDRIEEIKECTTRYREDKATADKEYFLHTIGITKGQGPVEEIQLAFTPAQGHFIKTLHLHHSQRLLKDDKKEVVISLQLIQNYELCQLILSFTPNVTILQPQSLRDKVVAMLKEGLERNENPEWKQEIKECIM